MSRIDLDSYESGYAVGYDEGYRHGCDDTAANYEKRIAQLYVEMKELEARVAVLDRRFND